MSQTDNAAEIGQSQGSRKEYGYDRSDSDDSDVWEVNESLEATHSIEFDPNALSKLAGIQSRDTFQYKPLDLASDEIRLLTLEPSETPHDPIRCTLKTTSLSASPKYKALSYVWGSETERYEILVNDCRLSITPNLYSALIYLREHKTHRHLWIDAISIDQSNMGEKAHQVLRMQDIFAKASRVLIWLGQTDEHTHVTMMYLAHQDLKAQLRSKDRLKDPTEIPIIKAGIQKLLSKPWFSRIWVVQEFLVARKEPRVGCGKVWVKYDHLHKAMMKFAFNRFFEKQEKSAEGASHLNFFFMSANFNKAKRTVKSFRDLVYSTNERACTDPRDKIYALLGLAEHEIRDSIQIDYSSPVHVVYEQATMALFRAIGNLELLLVAPIVDKGTFGLSSWCPNYSSPNWLWHLEKLGRSHLSDPESGAAGPISLPPIVYNSMNNSLTVEAMIVGTIEETLDISYTRECNWQTETQLKSGWKSEAMLLDLMRILAVTMKAGVEASAFLLKRLDLNMVMEQLREGVIWRVIAEGSQFGEDPLYKRYKGSNPDDFAHVESWAQKLYPATMPWAVDPSDDKEDMSVESWIQTIHETIASNIPDGLSEEHCERPEDCFNQYSALKAILASNRTPLGRLVFTDTGYVGNALCEGAKGDLVCIVFGCSQPLVLRKCGTATGDDQQYRFLTSAWVDGIMKGEFVNSGEGHRQRIHLV